MDKTSAVRSGEYGQSRKSEVAAESETQQRGSAGMQRKNCGGLSHIPAREWHIYAKGRGAGTSHNTSRLSGFDHGPCMRTIQGAKVTTDGEACVRFRSQAYHKLPLGNLLITRTEGSTPFQFLGVDFAGAIR